MKLKTKIAINMCHAARWLLRKLGRGGTDQPGRLALKIDKNILRELSKDMAVVVVTGTNGKTTVCRMIEQGFKEAGYHYIANRSGANLIGGVVTTFCDRTKDCTHAVIECDEAAFAQVSKTLSVQCVVVTNIFRDQLDRYGEITTIRGKIAQGISRLPDATLCLNADCSLTASLAKELPNPVVWYGIEQGVVEPSSTQVSDAQHCIFCKTKYVYSYQLYSHLGGFHCPNCGYTRPEPDVRVQRMIHLGQNDTTVEMDMLGQKHTVTIAVPGAFNVSNAAASSAALLKVGLSCEQVCDALRSFECGFGRTEQIQLGKANVRMLLVKNPTGFNQVIQYICQAENKYRLVLILNDKPADGTDISWIWDVDFESLAEKQAQMDDVLVSGIRSAELMVRLKYAGFDMTRVQQIPDTQRLLDVAEQREGVCYMVPSYTAMFGIRKKIEERTGIKAFYE